jgi:chlorobactene glucosyltransferase
VRSLLAQQYTDFQVIVLDDDSTDGTWRVLESIRSEDDNLTILKGEPLPEGWTGKNWACHQLSQAADGELLLFTDADTRHEPDTLRCAMAALLTEDVDLVSAFPREKVISWAEQLIIPVIPWSMLSFMPLGLAYRLKTPLLSATNGQFMLLSRRSYELTGGHMAVRHDVVDDIALGKKIKAEGLRWRMLDGGRHIQCRMYESFSEVYQGISKNLFAAFSYNVPVFLFIWLWLGLVFLEPPIVLILGIAGISLSGLSIGLALVAIALALTSWGISHWRFHFPLHLAFFYPLTIILTIVVAMNSMVATLTGSTRWKGRTLPRPADWR